MAFKFNQRKLNQRKLIRLLAIGLVTFGITILSTCLPVLQLSQSQPNLASSLFLAWGPQAAQAQRFDPASVWQQVYEQLELPLENQYIHRETGEVDQDNTLVSRFIRYHIYIQGRPPIYRLDWKLTMADYLGANEFISATTYPSADTLTINPMEGDVAAIQSLNRAERDAMIQTIVDIFRASYTPSSPETDAPAAPTAPSSQPLTSPTAPSPRTPQPGDADLLLP